MVKFIRSRRSQCRRHFVLVFSPDLGSMNTAALEQARDQLMAAANQIADATLEVELYCHTAGARLVGILAEVAEVVGRRGGRLRLRHVDDHVAEAIRVCGYGHLLDGNRASSRLRRLGALIPSCASGDGVVVPMSRAPAGMSSQGEAPAE